MLERLYAIGYKRQCEICGKINHCGYPASMDVHHVNGDCFNNKIENLQILCVLCHHGLHRRGDK